MVSIILVVLFISQLLSFFFIILLNSKLAKFKDLEMRQERVTKELDDAIGFYLMEMKEENDRLIQELTAVKQTSVERQHFAEEENTGQMTKNSATSSEPELFTETKAVQQKKYVPLAFAANAYSRQKQHTSVEEQLAEQVPEETIPMKNQDEQSSLTSFEREVVEMHRAGKTIEEIAKKTQKGKTEIELLLKFHA
jgi:hypothetical protein